MTKIEEIIENNRLKTYHYADQDFVENGAKSITSAMKEYAEWYAKRCLEIAAKEAQITSDETYEWQQIVNEMGECPFYVDEDSIIDIILPEHS